VILVTMLTRLPQPVDGYPALLPNIDINPVTGLMVIAATDNKGVRWAGSQTAAWVTHAAPGVEVTCASTISPRTYRPSTGTSDGKSNDPFS
jgi:hypothetical protein